MARSLNPALMMKARDMYARGFSKSATARALHVSSKTVCRWAAHDEGRGLGWDKERQARLNPSEEKVTDVLQGRMAPSSGGWRAPGRTTRKCPLHRASKGLLMG